MSFYYEIDCYKASLPEIGFVTGQPRADIKGFVILAALVTSIVH